VRGAVSYDLSYSFIDVIIGNCSDAPSLQNAKANPLIINVEKQRHKCMDVNIMLILYGIMATLCLAPVCFLCILYKVFNRKREDLLGRGLAQISVMDIQQQRSRILKPKAAIIFRNCSDADSGVCA